MTTYTTYELFNKTINQIQPVFFQMFNTVPSYQDYADNFNLGYIGKGDVLEMHKVVYEVVEIKIHVWPYKGTTNKEISREVVDTKKVCYSKKEGWSIK